ncbi:MAG: SRPBCC family protein [Pseudomonadota bacterium]|nr:SRPBCC family protein [Pseudomonadota bacterium]
MKVLREEIILDCSAKVLWEILSDISRCDWVPTVDKISLDGDCRIFEMEGMGPITEKILLLDNETMTLQYSAIDTPVPIKHHLASMSVVKVDEEHCQLEWKTEIDPEIFAEGIYQGMLLSIEGIRKLLHKI